MTTGSTTLLGLALPVEGELDGTWGDTVNDSITSLLDSAVAGATTLSADADVTLTTTTLAANQARQAILIWTASNGATTRTITAPARSKTYAVINAGTGSIVLRGATPTTGITIIAGERCVAGWNGSDFVKVASTIVAASNLTGAVAVANGGTGQTSYTDGQLLIGNSSGNTLTKATLTAGSGVTITNGSGGITIAASGSGGTVTSVTGTYPILSSGGATPDISLGTVAVTQGGTGLTSLTAKNLLVGNGTSAVQTVAPGANGSVLTSNGTDWVAAPPTAGISAGKSITFALVFGQ
jgi:hypothetical protein